VPPAHQAADARPLPGKSDKQYQMPARIDLGSKIDADFWFTGEL
jgi:hypothetical protein